MRNTSKITGGLLTLALGLPAQELPETVLQRAKTLHELEHDAAGAAELYRRVAADASVDAAVRSKAWLDLAEVERSLGKVDAAKAALSRAAEGEGEAAAEATRRLQDPAATRSDVELQILQAIQNLRANDAVIDELVFYGERALPLLFRSVENEAGDLEFVRRGACVVWMIGGERARAWLGSDVPRLDALRRRAVVHGVPGAGATSRRPAAGTEASFAAFFDDPDPGVRLEACEQFDRFPLSPELESFVDLLLDPDVRVASAAAQQLVASNTVFWVYGPPSSKVRAVSRLLEARNAATVPAELLGRVAEMVSNQRGMWATPSSRALLIGLVEAFPAVRMPRTPELSELRRITGFEPFTPDELAPEILSLVRSLGERPLEDQRTFDNANHVVWLLADLYEHWTHDSMPVVLELARRGFGGMDRWVAEHATREDWLAIASDPSRYAVYLVALSMKGLGADGLSPEQVAALRAWFDRATSSPPIVGSPPTLVALCDIVFTLAAVPVPGTTGWAERYIRSGASAFVAWDNGGLAAQVRWELFAGLTRRRDPERVAAVRRIALDPALGDHALRNHAVGWLIHQGAGEPIELILAARELGLAGLAAGADQGVVGRRMPEMRANVSGHPIGVEWLLVEGLPGYDADRLDAILRELLERGDERTWERSRIRWDITDVRARRRIMDLAAACPNPKDLEELVNYLYQSIDPRRHSAVRVDLSDGDPLAQFLRGLASHGDEDLDRAIGRLYGALHAAGQVSDSTREVMRSFAFSDRRRLAEGALAAVHHCGAADDPEAVFREVYADRSSPARSAAFGALCDIVDAEERVDLLIEGLGDESLRFTALSLADNVFDERLVEPLLACLRDPIESRREQAQKALDAQRAWLEEEARWARLRADTRLDATSAADALLTQSAADQPKPIRLAAIRSLGTLALPETLPLLIEMLRDQDREITAAASAAIERINREQDD